MSNETIIVGNQYKVVHVRKGTFCMLVTNISQGGEWIHGVVKRGTARAMLPENEMFEGDKITIRASFCSFASLEENGGDMSRKAKKLERKRAELKRMKVDIKHMEEDLMKLSAEDVLKRVKEAATDKDLLYLDGVALRWILTKMIEKGW